MPNNNSICLYADWQAPSHVHACITTRNGGFSKPPYQHLNLSLNVGDNEEHVHKNRQHLIDSLGLPDQPHWLTQQHGNLVIPATHAPVADGSYTRQPNTICAVLTADCLPLLLCDKDGQQIAAIHVGWRGFCKHIIAKALATFPVTAEKILAWLGPCISNTHYQVGANVRDTCIATLADTASAFTWAGNQRWHADLHQIVQIYLRQSGVQNIFGKQHCTYQRVAHFFSYRRDKVTGRMASLIWMD